jgi:hypothetical protein
MIEFKVGDIVESKYNSGMRYIILKIYKDDKGRKRINIGNYCPGHDTHGMVHSGYLLSIIKGTPDAEANAELRG